MTVVLLFTGILIQLFVIAYAIMLKVIVRACPNVSFDVFRAIR